MMRITEGSMQGELLRRLQMNYARTSKASVSIGSGMRIQNPSEDPAAAAAARRIESHAKTLTDCLSRAGAAKGGLQTAEAVLGEMGNTLLTAYELAVQMSSDTYDADDRATAAQSIEQIRTSVLGMANTQYDGRYLFAGRAEDTAPFGEDGVFQGDDGGREIEVAPGLKLEATVSADSALGGANGNLNLFDVLEQLGAAMQADDGQAIADLAAQLEEARDQVTGLRADLGSRLNLVQDAENLNTRLEENLIAQRSELLDTDIAKAATEFNQAQQAMEAAVSVNQRLMSPQTLRMLMTA